MTNVPEIGGASIPFNLNNKTSELKGFETSKPKESIKLTLSAPIQHLQRGDLPTLLEDCETLVVGMSPNSLDLSFHIHVRRLRWISQKAHDGRFLFCLSKQVVKVKPGPGAEKEQTRATHFIGKEVSRKTKYESEKREESVPKSENLVAEREEETNDNQLDNNA